MKYKKNLKVVGDKVLIYNIHVATIVLNKLIKLGYWSQTTSKHINYVASLYGLEVINQSQTKGEQQ